MELFVVVVKLFDVDVVGWQRDTRVILSLVIEQCYVPQYADYWSVFEEMLVEVGLHLDTSFVGSLLGSTQRGQGYQGLVLLGGIERWRVR